MYTFRRKLNHISRTCLLDGSPANRTFKWALTIFITGIWIYTSERRNPRRKGIFFRTNKAEIFEPDEMKFWNSNFQSKEFAGVKFGKDI